MKVDEYNEKSHGYRENILKTKGNNKKMLYALLIQIYLWYDFISQRKGKIRDRIT
jgi:hypothetical protein